MSDMDINRMDFKQLRKEVQTLRDELALFKRRYEDLIYNLDSDNFGKSFTVEQDSMRSQIKITAEAITSMVSNEEFETAMVQTADKILHVATEIIDKSKAKEVSSPTEFTDPTKIYVIREYDDDEVVGETFYYYNSISETWQEVSDTNVTSLFEQTSDGFKLRGDVQIDGKCILTDSLTFNSADKPVQVQYSVDGKSDSDWHDTFNSGTDMFMRMKVGANWTGAIKINARDGVDGDKGDKGDKGDTGEVTTGHVTSILEECYSITQSTIDSAAITSPIIFSAELYSPNIYGENIVLESQNESDTTIYNNMSVTPSSLYLTNAHGGNEKTKFLIDLGKDADNSTVKMRLGAGADTTGIQALNIEKYENEIRIGTYTYSENNQLKGFAGMIITPDTGAVTFTGTVQAVAVFG